MSNANRLHSLHAAWSGVFVGGMLLIATFFSGPGPTPAAAAAWSPAAIRPQMCTNAGSPRLAAPAQCIGSIACCK